MLFHISYTDVSSLTVIFGFFNYQNDSTAKRKAYQQKTAPTVLVNHQMVMGPTTPMRLSRAGRDAD